MKQTLNRSNWRNSERREAHLSEAGHTRPESSFTITSPTALRSSESTTATSYERPASSRSMRCTAPIAARVPTSASWRDDFRADSRAALAAQRPVAVGTRSTQRRQSTPLGRWGTWQHSKCAGQPSCRRSRVYIEILDQLKAGSVMQIGIREKPLQRMRVEATSAGYRHRLARRSRNFADSYPAKRPTGMRHPWSFRVSALAFHELRNARDFHPPTQCAPVTPGPCLPAS